MEQYLLGEKFISHLPCMEWYLLWRYCMFLKQERTLMKEAKNYMSLTLNALLRPSHVSNPLFRFSTSKHSQNQAQLHNILSCNF